jgi:Tfp pilus assembly protein PilX
MSLARASEDPVHKQRYQNLALEFAQSALRERDLDIAASDLSTPKQSRTAAIPASHK